MHAMSPVGALSAPSTTARASHTPGPRGSLLGRPVAPLAHHLSLATVMVLNSSDGSREVAAGAAGGSRRRQSANLLAMMPQSLPTELDVVGFEMDESTGRRRRRRVSSPASSAPEDDGTGNSAGPAGGHDSVEARTKLEASLRKTGDVVNGMLPGSRRSERLLPRSRISRESRAKRSRTDRPKAEPKGGLHDEDVRDFLRHMSVPLPDDLTPEDVSPDMEFCIEKRLVLEQGRLQAKGLQPGAMRGLKSRAGTPKDSVTMFINTIGNYPLLTRDEEGTMMTLVSRWRELQEVLRAVEEKCLAEGAPASADGEPPAVSDNDWAEAAGITVTELTQQRWCGEEARFLMAQFNLRLVVHIAKKYANRGVDLTDLIAEGMEGLLKAVDKFDHERGVKFSTYSHWWVRQAITRSITNQSRVVRLPVHVWDLAHKILRVEQEIMAEKGYEEAASPEEVAEAIGVPVERVVQIQKVAKVPKSLDGPAYTEGQKHKSEEEPNNLVDTIAVYPDEPTLQVAKDELIKEDINALLSTLPPRERNVIRMRYGLAREDGNVMTFNDIGAAYGLTRERIRQIEEKALRKLKRPQSRRILRSHLYSTVDNNQA